VDGGEKRESSDWGNRRGYFRGMARRKTMRKKG